MFDCFWKNGLFAAMLLATAVFAADGGVWNHPAKASELGDAIQILSAQKEVRGSFKQLRKVLKINRTFESSGEFSLSRKELVFDIRKPFPSKMVLSESGIVQVGADGVQMKISAGENAVFDEISETMRAVVSGDLSMLQKRFEVYFLQRGKSWEIGLLPKEKAVQSVMEKILVKGDDVLKEMEIVDGEGNVLTYEFKSVGK